MSSQYLFTSQRLGFRTWSMEDLDGFAEMNANDKVMEYFPKTLTRNETMKIIEKLMLSQEKYGYCYYATELLETKELIGMIGFGYKTFASEFTPATDIGWRLKRNAWGKGYATEGAKRCLQFGFNDLGLTQIVAIYSKENLASERVMEKIGMKRMSEFNHPDLKEYPKIEGCIWYRITRKEFKADA